MIVRVIGTGSTGNLYFITWKNIKLVLEAGVKIDNLQHRVNANGLDAVIISHAHGDHSSKVMQFVNRYPTEIFATPETIQLISNKNNLTNTRNFTAINIDEFYENDKFKIEFFETSHDIEGAVVYRITNKINNEKLTFITDTGQILPHFKKLVKDSDYLMLEANYDDDVIYKRNIDTQISRVLSDVGHLSVQEALKFIIDIKYTKPVLLIHKSVKNTNESSFDKIKELKNITVAKNGLDVLW